MKVIGLVMGHHSNKALEIKAALLAADPALKVILDPGEFSAVPEDATDTEKMTARKRPAPR